MKALEFWHNQWAANRLDFHLEDTHPLLMQYWSALRPQRQERVLVPLCGKSEDLVWLASKHDEVQAVELSPIAVRAFFAEHFYTPLVIPVNHEHELYQFDELSIYTGDFFTAPLEPVDLVYDRAALEALPPAQRQSYVAHLTAKMKAGGRILLIIGDCPTAALPNSANPLSEMEVRQLYQGYTVTCLQQGDDLRKDEGLPQGSTTALGEWSASSVFLIEGF